jgi:hypothetical protein
MNVLEVFGLAFIVVVIINLISMVWAIKKARLIQSINLTSEQEV